MASPHAAKTATAAVNRLPNDLRAGIFFANRKTRTARQRLMLFGIRESVVASAFQMRRRNAPAPIIAPPRTIGGQR
jgi:hypothetical protein